MAISKIILNGVTQMDVTGKTVTSASMRNGVTALKNDGTDITGSIPDMTLPSTSSATSSGTSKATITPTSSAQYLNIPEGYNDTAQFYTIAAASGGASNVVTGTFKGTTTGSVLSIDLPYSGSGYPIAILVYPKDGANPVQGDFYSLIQRYAIDYFTVIKNRASDAPTYSGSATNNYMMGNTRYKSSSSSASTYSRTEVNGPILFSGDPSASVTQAVRMNSSTKLKVFIASTSYGFAANIDYTYYIIYSS